MAGEGGVTALLDGFEEARESMAKKNQGLIKCILSKRAKLIIIYQSK